MYKVSWNEFESLSIELAKNILDSGKKFTAIVGVSRGGLLLARLLSSILKLPMGVIDAKYVQNKYVIDEHVSTIFELKGDILLVDDVLEIISKEIILKIKKNYKHVTSVSSASIFYKTNNNFKPDFYVNNVKDMLTIIFPYQEISINENFENSL